MAFTMSGAAVPVIMTLFGCLLFAIALFIMWMLLWGMAEEDGEVGEDDGGKDKNI